MQQQTIMQSAMPGMMPGIMPPISCDAATCDATAAMEGMVRDAAAYAEALTGSAAQSQLQQSSKLCGSSRPLPVPGDGNPTLEMSPWQTYQELWWSGHTKDTPRTTNKLYFVSHWISHFWHILTFFLTFFPCFWVFYLASVIHMGQAEDDHASDLTAFLQLLFANSMMTWAKIISCLSLRKPPFTWYTVTIYVFLCIHISWICLCIYMCTFISISFYIDISVSFAVTGKLHSLLSLALRKVKTMLTSWSIMQKRLHSSTFIVDCVIMCDWPSDGTFVTQKLPSKTFFDGVGE